MNSDDVLTFLSHLHSPHAPQQVLLNAFAPLVKTWKLVNVDKCHFGKLQCNLDNASLQAPLYMAGVLAGP